MANTLQTNDYSDAPRNRDVLAKVVYQFEDGLTYTKRFIKYYDGLYFLAEAL